MRFKSFLSLLCLLLFSINSKAQKQSIVDSVKEQVYNKKEYHQKITTLQSSIKKIYNTNYDETIQLAQLGYTLSDQKNDRVNKGDFLRIIGLALGRKGYIDSASVYYYRALKQLKGANEVNILALLYDDMARMYRKLSQPKRALEFYEKALLLYEKEQNLEGIARINNESGVVFRDEGNYAEANKRFEKSLHIQQERKDSVGIGYALEFLGYNQLLVKDYKKSENYLLEALKIREKIADNFAIMLNYTALGEYYKETKQYQTSNNYFLKSNSVAKKINFIDIQKYNFEQITANYKSLGNYKNALESLEAFNILNDSLYTAQKLKDVEEITTKYETAEKEKKIAEKELALKIRNQWIFGLIALAFIVGLIGFLLYKQQVLKNHKQQKENELLLALEKIDSQTKLHEQRLTISRDLHDNIGAQLSFIVSAIDTIKYYISDSNQPITNKLNSIGTFAKETIKELRDTIWAMNKPTITIEDLKSRIANFMEKAKLSHQNMQILLKTDSDIAEAHSFTGLQGLNIFRIIQEATNNAVKYSEATEIKIHISKTKDGIQFEISDNGKGFVEAEVEAGNGLLNMRKRALELGKELKLTSKKNKGTTIAIIVGL